MTKQETFPLSETKKPRFFYGYVVVALAFGISALTWGSLRTFGVFFEPLIDEFGWMRGTISLAFTLCMIVIGLFGIVTGRLNDRFGPRVVVAVCSLFLGFGYFLTSQVSAIWQLYLFFGLIVAIGMSGVMVPMMSTVAKWFVKRGGLMTSIVVAGPAFGITTVPLVASWLISSYGWSTSFIIMGIAVLVLVITAAQFLRQDPSQKGQLPYGGEEVEVKRLNAKAEGFSLQEAIHTRQFWILSLISFANHFVVNVILVHIVIYATDVGISSIIAVTILSATAAISIVGRIIVGGVADRIGNRPVCIIGFGLVLVAFLWLLIAKELWMLYLFALIFGLGGWAVLTMVSPLVTELFGLRSHGAILGGVFFGASLGGAIGPVMAGYIFDISGDYSQAFLVCATISVIGLMLILLLKPVRREGRASESGRSA